MARCCLLIRWAHAHGWRVLRSSACNVTHAAGGREVMLDPRDSALLDGANINTGLALPLQRVLQVARTKTLLRAAVP